MIKYRWIILSLLLFATTINYADRFLLGLLKDTLMDEVDFTEQQYGKIVSAFQLAYGIGNLVMGYLIDRLGTKLGYLVSIIVWSLSSLTHAFAQTWMHLRISRFFLGLGESGNFPSAVKSVAEWFPKKERAFATGIFNGGSQLGIIIAGLIIPTILMKYGWQACFFVTGLLSLTWMVLWGINYKLPEHHKKVDQKELDYIKSDRDFSPVASENKISQKQLMKHRETWAVVVGKLLADPVWWFYVFWGASFLNKKFGINIDEIALPLVVIYLTAYAGGVLFGGMSSALIKKGLSVNRSRKLTLLACALVVLPVMFATQVENGWVAIILIALAAAGHTGWANNVFTLSSDIFPGQAVGRVVGLGGAASTFGSALAAIGVGSLLQGAPVEGYTIPFIVAALGYMVALIVIQLLVPNIQSINTQKFR
ncbi:MAG: MFS transporter [Bacteroidales bacterium]